MKARIQLSLIGVFVSIGLLANVFTLKSDAQSYITPPLVDFLQTENGVSSPTDLDINLLSQIGGSSTGVAVDGNFAYIGIGPRLFILDVSNINSPAIVGRTEPLKSYIHDVTIDGDYAYVAGTYSGLHVIRISDEANQYKVDILETGYV